MKRILSMLALIAMASLALTAGVQASQHAKAHPAKSVHVAAAKTHAMTAMNASGCPVADASQCKGVCPLGGASAMTTAANATTGAPKYSHNGVACPASDPSQCPSSCARTTATAVAAKVSSK